MHEQLRATLGTEVVDWSALLLAESLLSQLSAMWSTVRDLDQHMSDWTCTPLLDPTTGRVSTHKRVSLCAACTPACLVGSSDM